MAQGAAITDSSEGNQSPPQREEVTKTPLSDAEPLSADIAGAFKQVQADLAPIIQDNKLEGFTENVAALQQNLVTAYIIEAFSQLGFKNNDTCCRDDKSGPILSKHSEMTGQLWRILEDASAIKLGERAVIRFASHEERVLYFRTAEEEFSKFPQHQSEYELLATVGSRLADCLSGKEDPLHLLFGDKTKRDLLTKVYTYAPVFSTGTQLLATFLSQLVPKHAVTPLRILEIGGGVGGTTNSIIQLLEGKECSFVYTFTDISSSLVAAAKKRFAGNRSMDFKVLDVEASPDAALLDSQDIIISTNTIHATKSLSESGANIRQMLAEDGILCLVELTRPLSWYDIVFGLLEGWWRFNDGRTHAIANAEFWDQSLYKAGFRDVYWTDADHKESDLIRLIVASGSNATGEKSSSPSQSPKASMETVLFRLVDNIPLYADIFYPSDTQLTLSKRPIGKFPVHIYSFLMADLPYPSPYPWHSTQRLECWLFS